MKHKKTDAQIGFLFVLPAFLFFIIAFVYPLIRSFQMSFFVKNLASGENEFIGLGNYIEAWRDEIFLLSLKNTVIFTVSCVFFQLVLGMGLALLLNNNFKGRNFFRGILLFPWVFAPLIAGLVWKWMYHPQLGIVNDLLLKLKIIKHPYVWLDRDMALTSVTITQVWRLIPFAMLMLLAGLQSISNDLYEAAELDGAGRFHKFIYITLPQLKSVILSVTLLDIIWTFVFFDLIYIMTAGGPAHRSEVLATYVYKTTFNYLRFGYGSALAWTSVFILLGFSIFYIWVYKKREEVL